jgi:glycosyltransferase involved in cell wall biosynthesis
MGLRLVLVVPFLDEERLLPEVLESIAAQTRAPDQLVLVDDGSTDRSHEIASAFAARHRYARVLRRPPRPPQRDRMVGAHELQAFQWALSQLESGWEIAGKLDADVRLTPDCLAEIERRMLADDDLGMAGAFLDQLDDEGRATRHRCPEGHVEGAVAFYRHACWNAISPLPAILGWDTIDEVRARMRGWRTETFPIASGNPLHLRRTGSHDGVLRGFRRAGLAAYAYGAHPAHVLAAAVTRLADRPRVLCALHYLAGWAMAAARRVPRAEPEARAFVRDENLRRLRAVTTLPSRR